MIVNGDVEYVMIAQTLLSKIYFRDDYLYHLRAIKKFMENIKYVGIYWTLIMKSRNLQEIKLIGLTSKMWEYLHSKYGLITTLSHI